MIPKALLFCIPHAGGSASVYQPWSRISHSLEVVPLELAGHGSRMSNPFYSDFDEARQNVIEMMTARLTDEPFIVFGHSMGGLLAYEATRVIEEKFSRSANMLIISAHEPPHLRVPLNLHELSDLAFIEELIQIGGMPDELLAEPLLLEMFLPIIRHDFKLLASYKPSKTIHSVSCPVHVLSGNDDKTIDPANLLDWRRYTTDEFRMKTLTGGHFFIREQASAIVRYVEANRRLRQSV